MDDDAPIQVSGKVWKEKGVKAGADKAAIVGTSWEKKMADKAARQRYLEQKRSAQAAYKDKRKVRGSFDRLWYGRHLQVSGNACCTLEPMLHSHCNLAVMSLFSSQSGKSCFEVE
jgi:hypothetical protein